MASLTGHPDAVPTPDADGTEGRATGKQPRVRTEGRFKGPAGRIEDYAIIGNCRTTALVGRDGSIDWLCLPRFDSDAVFARLLGDTENGHWQIAPESHTAARTRRRYRDNTLVLETEFETEAGTVALIDFMPFPHREDEISIVRLVEGRSGSVPMRMEAAFRFDYGRIVPWVRHRPDGIVAIAGPDALRFRSPIPLHGESMKTVGDFTVEAGDRLPFILTWYPSHLPEPGGIDPFRSLTDTETWWHGWAHHCTYEGPYREAVLRSAPHPQGADLCADRRHRRRRHHLAARGDRRRAQLGLSLLLDPRRDPDPLRPARRRLHRGGGVLARLAAPGRRRAAGAAADHVRAGRRAPADRAGDPVAGRLRGQQAGADRQRRPRPAAARRLWRADGRASMSPARST